jgi:hypothetical protein
VIVPVSTALRGRELAFKGEASAAHDGSIASTRRSISASTRRTKIEATDAIRLRSWPVARGRLMPSRNASIAAM